MVGFESARSRSADLVAAMKSEDERSQKWVQFASAATPAMDIVWRRIVSNVVDALLYSIPAYVLHWIIRAELGYSWADPPTPNHISALIFLVSWLLIATFLETLTLSAFRGSAGKLLTRVALVRNERPLDRLPPHRVLARTLLKMSVFFGFGIGLPRVMNSFVDYLRYLDYRNGAEDVALLDSALPDANFIYGWVSVLIQVGLFVLFLGLHRWRTDCRGIHDLMAGSVVVRSR